MRYYLAPLEGITGYIFRNAVHHYFDDGCIDAYFTPFFSPHTKRSVHSREIKDILPENNAGIHLIPQMLTDSADDFMNFESDIKHYGYEEANLNLGCPSGTVASKGRGAGFLGKPEKLDAFLAEVFERTTLKLSVKTRIGVESPDEFYKLLEIYNKYPISELIIHPRVKKEMYSGKVHKDIFEYAMKNAKMPLIYNGDVGYGCFEDIPGSGQQIAGVMCGRGMVRDPSLLRRLSGGNAVGRDELKAFLDEIVDNYAAIYSGEVPVLHKMKEIWAHMADIFPQNPKNVKKIVKSKTLSEYKTEVDFILRTMI